MVGRLWTPLFLSSLVAQYFAVVLSQPAMSQFRAVYCEHRLDASSDGIAEPWQSLRLLNEAVSCVWYPSHCANLTASQGRSQN
jgi:hypothetical protein